MEYPLQPLRRPAGSLSPVSPGSPIRSRSGRVRLALLAETLVILVLTAAFVALGMRSAPGGDVLVRVHDHQVAVRTDYWSGTQSPVTSPGYQLVVPQLTDVFLLDKSPVEFVLQGSKLVHPGHVPQLIVRASDGSNFWFNSISVQYGIDPARLEQALSDLGPDDPLGSGIVNGYVRSILRDEFGRYDPEAIVLPENLQAAVARAKERLNGALSACGLEVYEIAASKPSFDPKYEATIERAKVAEQEIEGLDHKALILDASQEARLEEVRQKKGLVLKKAQAAWEQQLTALQKEAERLGEGQEERLAQLRRYQELTLAKNRAKWSQELAAARQSSVLLQQKAEQQQRALNAEKGLLFEKQRAEWDRDLAKLQEEARRAQTDREVQLQDVRRAKALELGEARAKWKGELDTLEAELATLTFETGAYCASRIGTGQLERERQLARAEVLAGRYREEAAALLARSEALAEHGLSSVRAALIEKLSSISFEIVPVPGEHPAESPKAPAVAAHQVSEL